MKYTTTLNKGTSLPDGFWLAGPTNRWWTGPWRVRRLRQGKGHVARQGPRLTGQIDEVPPRHMFHVFWLVLMHPEEQCFGLNLECNGLRRIAGLSLPFTNEWEETFRSVPYGGTNLVNVHTGRNQWDGPLEVGQMSVTKRSSLSPGTYHWWYPFFHVGTRRRENLRREVRVARGREDDPVTVLY